MSMSHIDFEVLYHLAEFANEGHPFNENELDAMQHISNCEQCYDKFCSLMALADVTSESGYIVLSEIFQFGKETTVVKNMNEKIMAVIDVIVRKVKDSVSVVMEQVEQMQASISFEVPLAVAARGVDDASEVVIQKLESVENERTFITYDNSAHILLIQIDTRELSTDKITVFMILDTGEKIEIPMVRIGTLLKGKVENVPNETFRIYIKQA